MKNKLKNGKITDGDNIFLKKKNPQLLRLFIVSPYKGEYVQFYRKSSAKYANITKKSLNPSNINII